MAELIVPPTQGGHLETIAVYKKKKKKPKYTLPGLT